MTVLSVAYPLLPVSRDSGGGAEQILYLLERGLVARGHRSIVIAANGSTVDGKLIASRAFDGEMTEEVREHARRDHLRLIEQAVAHHSIDLIHFHGLDFYAYTPAAHIPKLATLHLPPAWYPDKIFRSSDVRLNCVSESQADAAPTPARLPVIPNGIDTRQYLQDGGERKQLLWLGRICPEKGVHIALEVAHRLNARLIVAGPVHPFRDHEMYFSNRVEPLLDDRRQYVGCVGFADKKALLAQAKCVLIPSLVAETSSLVAMEALSSGAPVVAYRSGALPEVIEHERTGFIVDSQDEMASAVGRVHEISSETCRTQAQARFDVSRMVDGYISLYESR